MWLFMLCVKEGVMNDDLVERLRKESHACDVTKHEFMMLEAAMFGGGE